MKYFKKFFTSIQRVCHNIYNSDKFVIAAFAYDSVNTTVDWFKSTSDFIEQMKLVIASLAVVGKHIMEKIRNILGKIQKSRSVAI